MLVCTQHPQIQKKSQYIKYLCCDDIRTLQQWINSIRIAKVKKKKWSVSPTSDALFLYTRRYPCCTTCNVVNKLLQYWPQYNIQCAPISASTVLCFYIVGLFQCRLTCLLMLYLHKPVVFLFIHQYGKQLYINFQEAMRRTEAAYDWSSLSSSSIKSGSSSSSLPGLSSCLGRRAATIVHL